MNKYTNYARLYAMIVAMKEGQTLALVQPKKIIKIQIIEIAKHDVTGREPDMIILDEYVES